MKINFVVHRGYPYPGGSEYYVHAMAKEMVKRGYDVTVIAGEIQGELHDGVKYTNDYQQLMVPADLTVVHGGDVISQNIAHSNSHIIPSKILYMIILPSESDICLHGMKYNDYLGYSTLEDVDHIRKHKYLDKARRVVHGIELEDTIVPKVKTSEDKTIFVSVGGFAPHKRMAELARLFIGLNLPNAELHLYGYQRDPEINTIDNPNVKVFHGLDKPDVMKAIAGADAYIMHSIQEGFGLVLLEAMANKTPVISRNIAGARVLRDHIKKYETDDELKDILVNFDPKDFDVEEAYKYVVKAHSIAATINDIEDILNER